MPDFKQPPRWPLQILKIICPTQLYEEIEGDIIQKFNRDRVTSGYRTARRRMIWNSLRFIRAGIILRNNITSSSISSFMIPYYLRMAWRNIAGSKFYSSLNLFGLTLGLAVGLLILLWVNNEVSYDSFHSKRDNIYRINTHLESNGEKFAVYVSQAPIGFHAKAEVPGIENVVRITDHHQWSVFRYNNITLSANAMQFIDPSFLRVFDFELLKGDRNNPFPDVHSVIVTESEARRFFGDEDPVGKILTGDNRDNLIVSGVLKDIPANSSIRGDMFFSTELYRVLDGDLDTQWGNYGWNIFLLLQPGASTTHIAQQLTEINLKHQPGFTAADAGSYTLQSLNDIHLYDSDGNPVLLKTVRTFSLVAILILVIAAINYVNLTTARALIRSKEVSIRKVIGAARSQLFVQFIVHTCLFFFIAIVLAFCLMALSMPLYNNIAGKQLQFDPLDPSLWKVIGLTLSSVLIASSIYPAAHLSSFNPVQALKGRLSFRDGSTSFRRILVVSQFTFSIGLIICTTIIGRQLKIYAQQRSWSRQDKCVYRADG